MELKDIILLIHPVIAVSVVFPLIGIVANRALQVRERRLQTLTEGKSKIPPAGPEHVQIGRWLTSSVVGIVLVALANDIFSNVFAQHLWEKKLFQVLFIELTFIVAIACFVLLYRAKKRLWRWIFASLAGISLIGLGCQDGVYRNTEEWYFSHYYYGIIVALLMIFSLAILPEIYQDKTNRWRNVHIILNSLALLIFFGVGMTGAKSLLEIPLSWQEPYLDKLSEQKCDQLPCTIQAPSIPQQP